MKNKIVFAYTILFALLYSAFFSTTIIAQPSLSVNRYTINWPQISFFINAKCGPDLRFDLNTSNFKIIENGTEIKYFDITCPDINRHCCASVSMVIDKTIKMGVGNPTPFDQAKACAKAYVDAMDPDGNGCDEASILSVSDTTLVDVFMTTDKIRLKIGIDSMTIDGNGSFLDGAIAGIQELVNNGSQECRGIILFTDGWFAKNCSSIESIIAFAHDNKIHLYTVGVGFNTNDVVLNYIADRTGGKYFKNPSPAQSLEVYKSIATPLIGGFFECQLEYNLSGNFDDSRKIDITLQRLFGCVGTDTKTVRIFSSKDPIPTPIDIKLGSGYGENGERVGISLELQTLFADTLPLTSFSLLFDSTYIRFDGIETKNNLLANLPITTKNISNGYKINFLEKKLITRTGSLATIYFNILDPDTDTTIIITLADWKFESGNFIPLIHNGSISIVAQGPRAMYRHIQAPQKLTWSSQVTDYIPNPFAVDFFIGNCGRRTAKSALSTIAFDTTRLTLWSPKSYTQQCIPSFVDPFATSYVSWLLKAKPAMHDDTVLITCRTTFDNNAPIVGGAKLIIPKAVTTDVEKIVSPSSFYLEQNYPNPFTTSTTINLSPALSLNKERESVGQHHATLKVFDVFGREVLDLSDAIINKREQRTGNCELTINNFQLKNPGVYFYRLTVGNESQTKMMVMMM